MSNLNCVPASAFPGGRADASACAFAPALVSDATGVSGWSGAALPDGGEPIDAGGADALMALSPWAERLPRALNDLRRGRPVLLMDDFDRENEADLIVAAETLSDAEMARMIRDGSGIVCLCLPDEVLQHLQLPPMVSRNESRFSTAFTVSIEARHGVSTGVSAADRTTTIRAAIAHDAQPADLVSPGHVFPLRAQPGGVLARRGHTEGSIDLTRLAGLRPAAVLCELMNPDGTMARGPDILRYAREHDLVMLTIGEIADHRLRTESGAGSTLSRAA